MIMVPLGRGSGVAKEQWCWELPVRLGASPGEPLTGVSGSFLAALSTAGTGREFGEAENICSS